MYKSERSLALKLARQGSSLKDLKSIKSVALELGKTGLATQDLPSLFANPSTSSELLKIHPSEEDDDDLEMSCDQPATQSTGDDKSPLLFFDGPFRLLELSRHQAVAVPVHVRTLVTVCCIYLPPNDTISQNDLNTLIDQLPTPFILLVSHADRGGTTRPPPRYVFQRADWDAFTQLAEITDTMVSTSDITEAVQNVIDCIMYAATNSIPKSSPGIRKFRRPWWNEACRDSNKEQKRRWNIFRRCPTTENLIAFKRARASARRVRRRSQRESWIRFISSITSSTPSKLLWKKVKAANGIYEEFSFPVLNTGNVVVSSPLEVANTLGNAFAQVSAADSYSSAFVAIKNRAERKSLHFSTQRSFPYNSEFRMYELQTALSKAPDTSDPDGIVYKMLRHLSLSSLSNLLYLFKRIWNEQKFPAQWHEAVGIPVHKPGKDSSKTLHYRPIALTSCLCKNLERMVNARLVFHLEKEACIPLLQSGFRCGRQLLIILSIWRPKSATHLSDGII
ncbi:hypothetical protein AVEN_240388-1 [Araneus ventricosus]|uniref:Reverse transcriptase domain-containing protein n=1 Tax=Araneus ventricosus TaxID=182803 RepID=A0A4Y2F3X4_ARAVE|nr:hypothetical protein AVEN_240388-1 [Araneus ventricosus]